MDSNINIQPGYSVVSPYLTVSNVETAMIFYHQAFGFEKKELAPGPDGSIVHGELLYEGQTLMIGKMGTFGSTAKTPSSSQIESPITLYIYCNNVDKFYQRALAAGAVSVQAPEDMFWGDRMCSLKDPDGYIWNFATHTGNMDLAVTQM